MKPDFMKIMSEPVEIIMSNKIILPCGICSGEATEQLPNETGMYVCYGCKIAQREVID